MVDVLDGILKDKLETEDNDYMLEDVDIGALVKGLKPFIPILMKLLAENEKEVIEGLECLKPIFGKLMGEFLGGGLGGAEPVAAGEEAATDAEVVPGGAEPAAAGATDIEDPTDSLDGVENESTSGKEKTPVGKKGTGSGADGRIGGPNKVDQTQDANFGPKIKQGRNRWRPGGPGVRRPGGKFVRRYKKH